MIIIFILSQISLSQGSETSSAGWFCLSISHEAAVKLLARTAISEDSNGTKRSASKLRRIARCFISSPCGPPCRTVHNLASPIESGERKRERSKETEREEGREGT